MGRLFVFAVIAMLVLGSVYAAIKLRGDISEGRHALGCLGLAALLGSLGGAFVIVALLGGH